MRRGCSATDVPGIGSSAVVDCGSRGRRTEEIEAAGPNVAGLPVATVDCSCCADALAIVAENEDASAVRAADVVVAAVRACKHVASVLQVV